MLHLVAISIKKSSLVQKKHWHSNSSVVYSAENKTVDYKQTAKRENIFEIFSLDSCHSYKLFVSEPLLAEKRGRLLIFKVHLRPLL